MSSAKWRTLSLRPSTIASLCRAIPAPAKALLSASAARERGEKEGGEEEIEREISVSKNTGSFVGWVKESLRRGMCERVDT